MPNPPAYRSQVLDHRGLVAGMFDELSIGDVIDQATHQDPELRDLTVGEAVKTLVLTGFSKLSPPTARLHLVLLPNSSTMRLLARRWRPSMPMG
jgi:Domain of unknown function (DUF4277)